MFAPLTRRCGAGVAASMVAVGLAIAGSYLGMFWRAELALSDWRDAHATTPPSGNVLIVAVDQQSLAEYGGWPIDRRHMAKVLHCLEEAGANRVYLDSSLARDSHPESDLALEDALQRLGRDRVALPMAVLRGKPDAKGQRNPVSISSIDRFAKHAQVVSADMSFDADGRVRSIGRTSFHEVAAQPTVAAWLAKGRDADRGVSLVNYGIDLEAIPVLSFRDVEKNGIPAGAVSGRNVVVGLIAEGVMPPVCVPRYDKIQRAEFMALAAETLLAEVQFFLAPLWMVVVATGAIALVLGVTLPRFGMATGGAITMTALILICFASVELQRQTGLSLSLAVPLGAIILTFVGTLVATHPSFENVRRAAISLVDKVDYGLARLFHSGVDAIITFAPDGRILTVNDTAAKMFGVNADRLLGRPLSTVLPDTADSLLKSASGHQPGRLTATLANYAGQERHVDLAFNAVPSETGWVGYAAIRDITEMKQREETLSHQATHDAMTNLPNRAAFARHLDATLRFAADTQRPFALLLLDLNKFKQVNDTLGHHMGDALLVELARRFKHSIQAGDLIARLGGDEFAIVMSPPTDSDGAEALAARLVSDVADLKEIERQAIETGVSVGIAMYPEHAQCGDQLLQLADEAMYLAKRNGCGFRMAAPELAEVAAH